MTCLVLKKLDSYIFTFWFRVGTVVLLIPIFCFKERIGLCLLTCIWLCPHRYQSVSLDVSLFLTVSQNCD